MLDRTNADARVCVVGRTCFDTGIGAISYAACELLARSFPTCILPTDRPVAHDDVQLPNGRPIPICTDSERPEVFFYADILWNGAADDTLSAMPGHGLHIAHVCVDSDELPLEWVQRLNDRFEMALFPTSEQTSIAARSGVRIPSGTLPIALPLEQLLVRPFRSPAREKVRFGSVTAFHERKELELVVDAFLREFEGDEAVELILHSNLAIGPILDRLQRRCDPGGAPPVRISHEPLSHEARDELLESIDVFVNCSRGEGYSIGAREALALGKVLVLSDIHAHRSLLALEGVFRVPADIVVPAVYEELDGRLFGQQSRPAIDDVRIQLRQAYEFARSPRNGGTQRGRRVGAAECSFARLADDYAHVIDPGLRRFRLEAQDLVSWLPAEARAESVRALGRHADRLAFCNRLVIPAHDGGFFSVFNTFMSFLVWGVSDERCHMVLPDWDQSRLSEQLGTEERTSFCYGRPDDGNIWLQLFAPLYGLSAEEMNSASFLYERSARPTRAFNEDREPLLTFVNAFGLYRSPTFPRFRRQYHEAMARHVQPLEDLSAEADRFVDQAMGGRFVIAAHMKHPSHLVEQPDRTMPTTADYARAVRRALGEERIAERSDDWRLFLASDQTAVVDEVRAIFGDAVLAFDDVRRSTPAEDARYDPAAIADSGITTFQVQHHVAASPTTWSTAFAREVIRDALVMSRTSMLLHVVSNVATAVSFLNPSLEMRFVEPG